MATKAAAIEFNGTSRYAKLSTNATVKNMSAFTWMAWVKVGPLSTSQYQRAYVERQGSGSGIRFAASPYRGKLRFEFSATDGRSDTNYDYSYTWDDRWHHIAFVARISGATPTYSTYLDGNPIGQGTLVRNSGVTAVSNTAPLGSIYLGNASFHTSGGEVFASDRYWDGKMSEILIFDEAKNDGDILTYVASHDIWDMSDTSMFSYWRLDENSGSTTTDSDNGAWSGTLYQSGVASTALWTIDRPFLGNGVHDTTVPSTPTLGGTPTTATTDDGFTATWIASTDNVYVQFYELQVATVSDFSSYTSYDNDRLLTRDISGLLPATNYYWRVRAFDAENNASGYTATQSLTTSGSGDVTAPLPPTSLAASNITHSTFRISFTASASSDESGYKLDISTDPLFVTYLSEHRNKDIGNVSYVDVYGARPLTTYYARLRAYDAAENESIESDTLVLQTTTLPDVTAPLVLELLDATSITADAFTANWVEGVDDVGVAHYVIDLAYDETFASIVTLNHVEWASVNVGNVTSYRFDDLERETVYYYRVRAVDGAGNISQNATDPISVVTLLSSIDEGGFIQTIFNPSADAYVNSGATTTNYGTDTPLEVVGSGAAIVKESHLQFDLSYLSGTIQSAMLRLYTRAASAVAVSVSADNVTFDEATIDWTNKPTVGGSALTFTPLSVDEWIEIDIESILIDGPTIYDVKIWTLDTDNFTFDSREGANPPELVVETDPSTATQIEDFHFHDHDGQVINHITNPSGEDGTTTKWSAIGSVAAVVTNVTSDAYHGTHAFQVVCNGSGTAQGMRYLNTEVVAEADEDWTSIAWMKSVSGSATITVHVAEYTSGGTLLAETATAMTLFTTKWLKFRVSRLLTHASTERVSVFFTAPDSTAATFLVDAVALVNFDHETPYFDGDTSGAYWSGTVKASTSVMGMAELHADTTYIGDGDGDNSIVAYFKRSDQLEWITLDEIADDFDHNRGTKRGSALIGPAYGRYNEVRNPSFEYDVDGWEVLNGSGGTTTLDYDTDTYDPEYGKASALVTVSAHSGNGITMSETIQTAVGEVVTCRTRVKVPIGMTVELYLVLKNSAGVLVSELGGGDNGTILGDGQWHTIYTTQTMPSTVTQLSPRIYMSNTVADTFNVDNVQVNKSAHLNPYIDGDMPNGIWEGVPHNSVSGYMLTPITSYDFKHEYTDPEGIVDNSASLTESISDTHTTAAIADNVTTVGAITVTATVSSLTYSITYEGDDDDDMTVVIEYKRTDLSNWTAVTPTYERGSKLINGEIPNLKAGTSYTIRATFTDAEGVYGTNPLSTVQTTTTEVGTGEAQSTIMFGGFVLMGRSDEKIGVESHDAFGLPERRVQIENLPRIDGAVELSNLWGQRKINMTGFVVGNNRGDLEDNTNALKRALAPSKQRLVIDTLSNQGRYYNATCESLGVVEKAGENIRHFVWDAEFVCADPFAYENALTVMPEFTIVNNSPATATNLGDLKISPYFKIRTTQTKAVTLTIVNNTTGERITPSATIVNGDRLVIDVEKLSVLKNGVEIDYAGGFPHLAVGANIFKFSLTSITGTPDALVEISWRHRYL